MTGSFHSIDPGGQCLGWASWADGCLTAVGLSRTKAATWQARARHHRAFLEGRGAYAGPVVTECMRVRGGRNVGNPQILVELNAIAGHVGTAWVEPAEWKGRVAKEEHQPHVWAALTPAERALLEAVKPPSLAHNAVDAVGIGLFCLGRLAPRGAKPTGKTPKSIVPKRKKRSRAARGGLCE